MGAGAESDSGTAKRGEDDVLRCPWGDAPEEYRRYHDEEWGRPVGDESRIYEKLCLEGFQGGLSWLTILRKRDAFRRAFAGFDPSIVAGYGDADVDRLLADPSIVRNRAKILATINNARAVQQLHADGGSLAVMLWQYEPKAAAAPERSSDIPATTPESTALSKELRRRGFGFVGPTTVYAAMQSLGVVNDHLQSCSIRNSAEHDRSRFVPPVATS